MSFRIWGFFRDFRRHSPKPHLLRNPGNVSLNPGAFLKVSAPCFGDFVKAFGFEGRGVWGFSGLGVGKCSMGPASLETGTGLGLRV